MEKNCLTNDGKLDVESLLMYYFLSLKMGEEEAITTTKRRKIFFFKLQVVFSDNFQNFQNQKV
jgi:hypothetical protein